MDSSAGVSMRRIGNGLHKPPRVRIPDLGGLPDTVERRCTDVPSLFLFLVCACCWVTAMWYAVDCGDFNRLGAFEDGAGRRCNSNGQLQRLFFCRNSSTGSLDMQFPVCVPECPTSAKTTTAACGAPDYHTTPILGMVCLPAYEVELSRQQAQQVYWFAETARTTVAARVVVERYRSLIVCMSISIIASYVEIYILEYNASCLVKFGMVTLSGGCLLVSLYLFGFLRQLGLYPDPSPYIFPGATVLAIFGILFACILVSMRDAVAAACDCIELACTCIMRTPHFTLLPLVVTILNLLVGTISAAGCILMLSCGHEGLVGHMVAVQFGPIRRLAFWTLIFVWVWAHQVIFGMSQFMISNATSLWYFRGDTSTGRKLPRWAICRAFWQTIRFHFGTVALGGAVIFVTRFLRLPVGMIVSWTRLNNPVGRVFSHCCCGIESLYRAINPLSKNAFIDVAMNARPFFDAAHCADTVLMSEADTIRILNGATWVFQFVGVMANAALAACAMIWYCGNVIGDDTDVVLVMSVAGAVTGGLTAFPFALIFDTVSDTIFYCSEVELLRNKSLQQQQPALRKSNMVARLCPCVYPGKDLKRGGEASMWETFTFINAGVPHGVADPASGDKARGADPEPGLAGGATDADASEAPPQPWAAPPLPLETRRMMLLNPETSWYPTSTPAYAPVDGSAANAGSDGMIGSSGAGSYDGMWQAQPPSSAAPLSRGGYDNGPARQSRPGGRRSRW
mmetsp:Transcript_119670/g.343770  ORF Transcript_119670/g.343770 Transcript_119670/m.343770 type:complete len:737 (+) Transcript_119670:93-2303(+)